MQAEATADHRTSDARVRDGQEIELKLLLNAESMKLLKAAPPLTRGTERKGVVRRLEATYFDTDDCAVARHGASLRVRRSGRRHIQTLKIADRTSSLGRREIEVAVPEMRVRLESLPLAELGALGEALTGAELVPVFTTRIRRTQHHVSIGNASVEVAFDEGVLLAGDRASDVCEVELELKDGHPGALYDLALSLLDHAPFRIGHETKAERGYRLAFGNDLSAAKANASGLVPGDTVDEALSKILSACFDQMLANIPVAERGGDPKGVHQLRVALRRLRSTISAFKKEIPAETLVTLGADAKHFGSVLGPARNWDVFTTETIGQIEEAGLEGVEFSALRSALAPFRAHSYATARERLMATESTRFLLSLGKVIARRSWRTDVDMSALSVLTSPAEEFAGRTLDRLYKKALKQGRHLRHATPAARHSLRITLKKLRYISEFFLPLYEDADSDKFLRRIKMMQEVLGADNDVTTTHALLEDIVLASTDLDTHRAIGAVKGWQGRERIEAVANLRRNWRRFTSADPFWQ